MKKILASLSCTLLFAATTSLGDELGLHTELCKFERNYEHANFIVNSNVDVIMLPSVSGIELKMLDVHMDENDYYDDKDALVSFEQIKKDFSGNGLFAKYDWLRLIRFTSRSSGVEYYQIKSMPGENPSSTYFDIRGNFVGSYSDGFVEIQTDFGSVNCNDFGDYGGYYNN